MKALPLLLLMTALLGACDDMTDQPKTKTYSLKNGMPAAPPDGTVSSVPPAAPPPVNAALLARGRDEYHIYCAPCHAERGDGHGMIVQRGFPMPPSFQNAAQLRHTPEQLYRTISDGTGAMYGFDARIAPADRWAIVAYVKALQLSRAIPIGDLSPEERSHLP
jgi:mono/diheme cytochrome c family protein